MKQQKPILHGRDHLPSGADPIQGLLTDPGGGDTLDELILAAVPDGFWKLNESSGSVAADSSGFGQDMSTTAPELNPVWAQPAGPPGQQTADFQTGTGGVGGTGSRVSRSWPVITGDFTAGIWVSRNDVSGGEVMGQGNPTRSGGKGWELFISSSSFTPANRPQIRVAGVPSIYTANALPVDTWAFLAVTYNAAAHEWKLYVNGLLEGTETTGAYTPVTSTQPLWIGHDGGLGGNAIQVCSCILSYGFLINRTLTGDELVAINDSTVVTDRTGYVLTINEDGQTEWALATIEVEY